MGRAGVRAAMQSYFSGAGLPVVGTVYRSRPKTVPAQNYNLSANGGSGSVLIIHLSRSHERRVELGGAKGGFKVDVHSATLEIRFKSMKADAQAAQDDQDACLDGIVAAIRADRTLGCAYNATTNQPNGPIWQAGEGSAGIAVTMFEPEEEEQVLSIFGTVEFEVWEWVNT